MFQVFLSFTVDWSSLAPDWMTGALALPEKFADWLTMQRQRACRCV